MWCFSISPWDSHFVLRKRSLSVRGFQYPVQSLDKHCLPCARWSGGSSWGSENIPKRGSFSGGFIISSLYFKFLLFKEDFIRNCTYFESFLFPSLLLLPSFFPPFSFYLRSVMHFTLLVCFHKCMFMASGCCWDGVFGGGGLTDNPFCSYFSSVILRRFDELTYQ